MPVKYTLRAQRDLASLRAHIEADSPIAAGRMVIRLLDACDSLEHFPQRGPIGRKADTRELTTIWPYVVVYRITPAGVQILRIRHGAQDR